MKHEFSLASKLATLDVGHVIFLEDDFPKNKATQMERQVTNIIAKSKRVAGRRFSTMRCDAITVERQHIYILRIERVE